MPDSNYNGVRSEQKVQKIDGHAQALTGNSKADGFLKIYDATADLPDAGTLPNGTVIVDAEASELLIIVAGAYLAVAIA